jgi:hypothetical protein
MIVVSHAAPMVGSGDWHGGSASPIADRLTFGGSRVYQAWFGAVGA